MSMSNDAAVERLRLARQALVETGYFREAEVGDDVAPRIIELASALDLDVERPLRAARAAIADRLRDERSLPPSEDGIWTEAYQEGLQYALDAIDAASSDSAGKE
jgi:hypothetical protein